jgi:GNAT superfamily N-acetyltransferase
MKIREWSIRAYREGDEEGIFKLYQAVYPSKQRAQDEWLSWWRWLYKESPAGHGRIILADANDRLAAQYAVVPIWIKVGRQTCVGAQSLDTMTHPDYRRRGLFETLAKEVYRDAAGVGINIVYGFPNSMSAPGFINKLDWFVVSCLKLSLKPLNWKNTIRIKIKNRLLSGLLGGGASLLFDKILFRTRKAPVTAGFTVTQVTSFDERFDRLFSRVSEQYPIMVARNKDYLNWRFSVPGKNYLIIAYERANEIGGYLVLRHETTNDTKVSIIFDMIAESEEVMHCLVSEAVKVCQQAGADFIKYSLIAGRPYHRVLRRNGFIFPPFTSGANFYAYSSDIHISKALLQDSRNWLVQTADSDTL